MSKSQLTKPMFKYCSNKSSSRSKIDSTPKPNRVAPTRPARRSKLLKHSDSWLEAPKM